MKGFLLRFIGGFVLIFMISLVTFFLFKALPGDAYADKIYQSYLSGGSQSNVDQQWNDYVVHNKLDKALFAFSLTPPYIDKRAVSFPLNSQFKDYALAARFYSPRDVFYDLWIFLEDYDGADQSMIVNHLMQGGAITRLQTSSSRVETDKLNIIGNYLERLELRPKADIVPVLYYYGTDNQFHFWMRQLFTGKLVSEQLNEPVFSAVYRSLIWTLSINIPAFLLFFTLGLYIGSRRSLRDNRVIRFLETGLYGFYSMPLFWLCTLALTIAVNWLPLGSFKILVNTFQMEKVSFLGIYTTYFKGIYLPILCIFLHNTIYISRHVEQSIDSVKNARFVLAARTRGISEKLLLRKHIVPNAVRPIITLIPQLLPGLVAGSVIIETIFNIPGMGRLFWDSLMGRDWQMIMGMVVFISTMVYLSMWLADFLYPRTHKVDAYE